MPPKPPIVPVAVPVPGQHVVSHRLAMRSARFPRAADLGLPADASRDYERLRIAFEISQALAVRHDLDDLLREVLVRVFELVPAERAAILLPDSATRAMKARVACARDGRDASQLAFPRSILDEVITHRVGLVATDAMQDVRFGGRMSVMSEGVRGVLAAPMIYGDEIVGVLYLDARIAGVFGERDLDVIALVAGQAALAVRSAQVRVTMETQERLELVSQLAAGLSHDFANVLTMVLASAELIYSDPAVPAEHRENAKEIETAAVHAARLTRRMGKLARGSTSELKRVDLGQFLEEASELLQQTLGPRVKLVVITAIEDCHVMADTMELEQIFLNLAFNARDAMPTGGQLTVELLRTNRDGREHAMFVIADTGTGMPADVVARAFEPFFTTKPAGRGTGMGLAVVHRLVTEARGQIALESTPGAGTTFRIDWPLSAGTAVVASEPVPEIELDYAILVVDDDPAVCSAMVQMLEQADYTVLRAATGEDALAIAQRVELQALVTDVVLTGMSGRQLAERVRALQPQLRVLFVSGYLETTEAEELTALDAGFLAKPFTQRDLVQKLRATVRSVSVSSELRRLELTARFATGAAFLAAYDHRTQCVQVETTLTGEARDRGVSLTVRLDDLKREFRVHGRIGEVTRTGARIILDRELEARERLLVAAAQGKAVPYAERAEARYPARLPVTLRTEAGLSISSHTQDVSVHGLMISSDHHIEAGTACDVQLRFPGRPAALALRGRVNASSPTGARRGVSVQLVFASPAQVQEMAAAVATLASAK